MRLFLSVRAPLWFYLICNSVTLPSLRLIGMHVLGRLFQKRLLLLAGLIPGQSWNYTIFAGASL